MSKVLRGNGLMRQMVFMSQLAKEQRERSGLICALLEYVERRRTVHTAWKGEKDIRIFLLKRPASPNPTPIANMNVYHGSKTSMLGVRPVDSFETVVVHMLASCTCISTIKWKAMPHRVLALLTIIFREAKKVSPSPSFSTTLLSHVFRDLSHLDLGVRTGLNQARSRPRVLGLTQQMRAGLQRNTVRVIE